MVYQSAHSKKELLASIPPCIVAPHNCHLASERITFASRMAPDMSMYTARIHEHDTTLPLPSFSKAFPHFDKDPDAMYNDIDPFTVNATTGFLPTQHPVKELPEPFKPLQRIVEDMPVLKEDGTPGLLATYELGPLIDSGEHLPDFTHEIDNLTVPVTGKLDLHLITALFRDYSFLASAYLLEPCWQTYNKTKTNEASNDKHNTTSSQKTSTTGCPHGVSSEYGLGRSVLPSPIARPLVKLAQILNIPPFMSYAASYALYNYYLVNPSLGTDIYSNIRLIRSFERGADPLSSEAGFILTHIHMVSQTGPLISSAISTLNAIEASLHPNTTTSTKALNTSILRSSLSTLLSTMQTIESHMEKMWSNSLPKDYPTYRTFIFGITSQPLFPNGVIYDGCFDNLPQNYRGESGANDSIIPLLDNLCQIPMPRNPLTDILKEFRGYRPESQRSLLVWVESKATELSTRDFMTSHAGLDVTVLYLRVLDHVRSFRWRHWMFAREYIIKRTKYPVATGGSPIVTWLPNQLSGVLKMMGEVVQESGLESVVRGEGSKGLSEMDVKIVQGIMEVVEEQKEKLAKEVKKYCEERGV